MSLPIKSYCRQVDSIRGTNQASALRLFTPLITDKFIKYINSQPVDRHLRKTEERSNYKKVIRADIYSGRLIGKRIFQNDKDVSLLTSGVDINLIKFFRRGYDEFTYGNWLSAKKSFEAVLAVDPKDGPTIFLMEYIKNFVFQKPIWWEGSRLEDGGSGH